MEECHSRQVWQMVSYSLAQLRFNSPSLAERIKDGCC